MDSRANYQVNIDGNVFVAVQNLFAEFTKIVQVVEDAGESVKTSTKQITEHVEKTANSFGGLQEKIRNISLTSIIEQVEKVSTAIANISGPGIGFEQSLADLSSITGIVGDELRDLARVARQTGRESGLGAQQAAQAFALLASQIQVDKIGMEGLKVLLRNTITLSHAAGMTMSDAATALAGTINQFGLQATEAKRVINVLAAGSKYGAAEIVNLSQSFKVVGAAASAAGLSVEATAGAVEVLSKNNLKGAEAGTALRNIVLKMQTALGVDFRKNSLSDALDALKPKLTDATYLSKIFGMENVAAAQFLIKNAGAVAEMTAHVADTNVAQEQAAIRTDTVQQMMARCQARIDDLKIGFFELTGSAGGYATIIAQQAVTIAQLLPLLGLLGSAGKLQAVWTGVVTTATTVWTGVQWLLNAALWACPITWIVAGITALIALIVVCVTKVQGWGKQWDSVVKFMKLTGKLFVETIKYDFNTMVNGIMIGLDYIKLGWYKFKKAVGLGDSSENEAMIAKISGDIDGRKQVVAEGAQKLRNLAKEAGNALTWELSWKNGKEKAAKPESSKPAMPFMADGTLLPQISGPVHLNSDKGGMQSGSKALDLNRIIPDIKGSATYSAIAARLSSVRIPSLATAAASLAMPAAIAATTLPQSAGPLPTPTEAAYASQRSGGITMSKFCDKIEIHIASADGKGYEQIEEEVVAVLKKVIDDYEA